MMRSGREPTFLRVLNITADFVSLMSVCVAVDEGGNASVVTWTEKQIASYLDNCVQFVGAMDELDVFIVGCSRCDGNGTHPWHAKASPIFLPPPPKGKLVFVASDAEGLGKDVDVDSLREALSSQYGVTF